MRGGGGHAPFLYASTALPADEVTVALMSPQSAARVLRTRRVRSLTAAPLPAEVSSAAAASASAVAHFSAYGQPPRSTSSVYPLLLAPAGIGGGLIVPAAQPLKPRLARSVRLCAAVTAGTPLWLSKLASCAGSTFTSPPAPAEYATDVAPCAMPATRPISAKHRI